MLKGPDGGRRDTPRVFDAGAPPPPPPIDWGPSPRARLSGLLLALAAIGAIVVTGLGVGVAAALYAAHLAMAGTP